MILNRFERVRSNGSGDYWRTVTVSDKTPTELQYDDEIQININRSKYIGKKGDYRVCSTMSYFKRELITCITLTLY